MKIKTNILPQLKAWFIENSKLITAWTKIPADTNIPSEKLVKDNLDKKIDKTSIKTVVNDTLTNDDVVGGKAVYDEIKKVEAGIPSGIKHTDITDWDTATGGFEKSTNKTTTISTDNASDVKYPTEKAVKLAIRDLQAHVEENYPSKTSVNVELNTKINTSAKTTELSNTSSDTQIPSAKAVYDLYSTIPKWHVEMVASIEDLPATGVLGTIYLVSDSGNGKNQYKEFFWNDSASEPGYEQFGGVEIDVSKFITKKQMTDYLANNSTLTLAKDGELALNIVDATE